MTNSEREVVAALGQTIAKRIGEKRYDLWFAKNTKLSWDDDHLIVHVPNRFFQEWLQSTFTEDVRAAASAVLGRAMQVRFVIDAELFQAFRKAQDEAALRSETAQPEKQTATQSPAGSSRDHGCDLQTAAARARAPRSLRRWHRLGDFVVGPCNRVAHASALSVVESPCEGANPLVLHGPVGTGKTHLLEGIYAGLRKNYPDWQVRYATSEDFTNRFVQSIRLGKLGNFRRYFRDCDALLVDDDAPEGLHARGNPERAVDRVGQFARLVGRLVPHPVARRVGRREDVVGRLLGVQPRHARDK